MQEAQVMETPQAEVQKASDSHVAAQFAAVMKSEHWLKNFMTNLLAAHQSASGLDFKAAEALLARERATFESEVAIAMRIFRAYPHLFRHEGSSTSASA
jgi:hypothetical protein